MIWEITLRQDEDSVAAPLPKEVLERLQVGPEELVLAIETENGILLTPYDSEVRDGLRSFDEVRRQYRNTIEKLD